MKTLSVALTLVMAAVVGGQAASAPASSAAASDTSSDAPAPPKLPRDFVAKGRYLVPDLGVQSLYDAELDEWMVMKTFRHRPGTVDLPDECKTAAGAPGS